MDLETFNPEKIESYRHAHESSTEWELRKKFLLAHHERFSADRLACLACCFINVECYGCTYPEGVMLQLKELALDIMVDIQQHRDTIQSQRDMKFVNAGGGNQGNARGEPRKKKTKLSPERDAHKSEKSTQNEFQAKEAKFIKLAAAVAKYSKNCADNVMQHLSVAVDKSKMKMTCDFQDIASGGFACHVSIDGVLVAKASARNKKSAKHDAVQEALVTLGRSGQPRVRRKGDGSELTMCEAEEGPLLTHERNETVPVFPWQQFVIIEPSEVVAGVTPLAVLHQSCAFNHFAIEFDFREKIDDGEVECRLLLDQKELAVGSGGGRQAAKLQAAREALSLLRQRCWTVQTKQLTDADHCGVSREEILGKTNAPTQALPGTNIGSIMMQKMGWTGGGIGREGREGRADPVAVEGVLCRQGLGLSTEQGVTPAFRQKISHLVSEYAVSAKDEDMSFASDFSKDERAAIHKECQKFGLKTHSHGKGEQRYLVVSRKRNKQQLVEHLMQKGGETSKYVLLPPATLNPSF